MHSLQTSRFPTAALIGHAVFTLALWIASPQNSPSGARPKDKLLKHKARESEEGRARKGTPRKSHNPFFFQLLGVIIQSVAERKELRRGEEREEERKRAL